MGQQTQPKDGAGDKKDKVGGEKKEKTGAEKKDKVVGEKKPKDEKKGRILSVLSSEESGGDGDKGGTKASAGRDKTAEAEKRAKADTDSGIVSVFSSLRFYFFYTTIYIYTQKDTKVISRDKSMDMSSYA